MTEKFSTAMYMDRGAEQLVEILNYYISAIVESKCPRGGGRGRGVCRRAFHVIVLSVYE